MRNVILMTLVLIGLQTSFGAVYPIASLYSRELGASYSNIAMLGTVASIFSLSSGYLWGHISDRTANRKRYVVLGLIALVITRLIASTIPSYHYLFALGAIEAVALAAVNVSSLALMGDTLESSGGRGVRMGLYRGLGSAGFGVMAFFSGGIADRLGLPTNYVLSSIIFGIAAIIALTIREEQPTVGEGADAGSPWSDSPASADLVQQATHPPRTRHLPMAPLLVAALVWTTMFSAVYSVWGNYMVEELRYSQTVMTRLWSVASTSELLFMVLAGWLSDRVGRLPMLALSFAAWSLVFAGYLGLPSMPWLVLVQLMRGFAFSAYTATAMVYATEVRSRESRGRASGLYTSAGGLGAILGAMAGGSLVQWLGFRPMLAIFLAVTLLTAVYLAVVTIRWTQAGRHSAHAWRAQ